MKPVREISDWGLDDALAGEAPVLGVGFVSRLDARHAAFLADLAVLQFSYGGSVPFRVVDLSENPSLVQKLKLNALPAVLVYAAGREHARWQGRVDVEAVAAAIELLIRAQEEIE
jgi:thioredoxin-like negative regulator of GroEL